MHLVAHQALRNMNKKRSKRVYGKNEAALKIQGMYRTRKARIAMKNLAAILFEPVYDAATGQTYYYNLKTGVSTWDAPKALQQ